MTSLLPSLAELPAPADGSAAETGFARWREAADEADATLAAFMRGLAADEGGHRLLAALFGNSPFLTECCLAEPGVLAAPAGRRARRRPRARDERARRAARRSARRARPHGGAASSEAPRLVPRRLGRHRRALAAREDHREPQPLRRAGARRCRCGICCAPPPPRARSRPPIRPIPRAAAASSCWAWASSARVELNYSSDVDLILLYDAERARYRGKRGVQRFFTAPRARSGAPHEPSARRTAMSSAPICGCGPIPARRRPRSRSRRRSPITKAPARTGSAPPSSRRAPVAGDREAGAEFLAELTPFLWRKHLDFAAIQDIHSIKRQIDAHRGGGAHRGRRATTSSSAAAASARSSSSPRRSSSSGAGASPSCASPRTCDALAALARAGRITDDAAPS